MELSSDKFVSACTPAFRETVRSFIAENIARRLARVRASHGMFEALERNEDWDEDTDLSLGASGGLLVFGNLGTQLTQINHLRRN